MTKFGNVELRTTQDNSYLIRLIKKHKQYGHGKEARLNDAIERIVLLKECFLNGKKFGVVYLSKFEGVYLLDGYKDITVKAPIAASVIAGNKMLAIVGSMGIKDIYSFMLNSERLVVFLLLKIGFVEKKETIDNNGDIFKIFHRRL